MSTPTITDGTQVPPLPPPAVRPPVRTYARSPWLAVLLNFFFPGAGQLYNGQVAKGFVFFFSFVGSIYGCVHADPMPFALFLPFIFVYSMIDAWRGAIAAPPDAEEAVVESPTWGASLVGLGLLLLLNNLGWLPLSALARAWPLILIALGALFVWRSMRATAPTTSAPTGGTSTLTSIAPTSISEPTDDQRG